MKQLVGLSNNIFFNKKQKPMIELIILSHEPEYEMINGQAIKRQKMHEIRLFVEFSRFKKIVNEFISETEEQLKQITK